MLYLCRHNDFRVESCSCIEKSGKLEVSREQDVTRTHVVRVVCCLSLTGYQSLQYVSLRLRTFFISWKSCGEVVASLREKQVTKQSIVAGYRTRALLASRLWRKGMMYEKSYCSNASCFVFFGIGWTVLFPNAQNKLWLGDDGQKDILSNNEENLSRYSILR